MLRRHGAPIHELASEYLHISVGRASCPMVGRGWRGGLQRAMKRKTLRAPAGSNEYFMHIDTGVKIQPPEAPKVYDIFWLPGLYPRKEQEEEKLEDVENIDLIADDDVPRALLRVDALAHSRR